MIGFREKCQDIQVLTQLDNFLDMSTKWFIFSENADHAGLRDSTLGFKIRQLHFLP